MKNGYKLISNTNKNFFLPENYPHSVKGKYMSYVKYNLLQQTSSSALGVLSTQQLLLSLGIDSLTASGALNWVIKDGLGQLGGVFYAGKTGNQFDADSKFQKWVSAFSINISCFIEILSPLFPGYFLLLASLGTFGKNISAISGSASRAAIHLNFANNNNLADITAKNTIQTTAACVFGTFVGTFFGYWASSYSFAFSYFCGFSFIHLFASYQGLKIIEINTLNQQRMDIVLNEFMTNGKILNFAETSKKEVFLKPYKNPKIRVGVSKTFENIEKFEKFLLGTQDGVTFLLFEESASESDLIQGYIKAFELSNKVSLAGISISQLADSGWNTSITYISPNSLRIKYQD
jgi:hypothetical protein